MSAIQKAILKVAGIDPHGKDESRQEFIRRAFRAVTDLDDKGWESLGEPVHKWYNDAADVVDANKKKDKKDHADLPDFPDAEADEAPRSRRRAADEPAAKPEPAVVKVGMTVTLTTQKGREYVGEVVEKSKDEVVLRVKGEELEFDMDKVGSIEVFNDGRETPPPKDEGPRDPAVGDVVELTTKRGRKVTGEVVELTDDAIVLKTDEGEDEFPRDRVETIAFKKQKPAAAAPKPEPAAPARRKAAAAEEPAGDDKKRVVNKGGLSVGAGVKQILAEDPDASMDEVGAELTKRGVEWRDVTLKMNYRDMQEFIKALRDAGQLKTKK